MKEKMFNIYFRGLADWLAVLSFRCSAVADVMLIHNHWRF